MRQVFYCLGAGAVALVGVEVGAVMLMDFAVAGARTDLAPAGVAIDRRAKSDALELGVFPVDPEHSISTVEVIGLTQAAIVYRDREGNILFRTDPLATTTVVVRGVRLPQVTVRETAGAPANPVIMPPQSQSKRPTTTPDKPAVKLPDGCEPASSPLSLSGSSAERARCLTALPVPARFASLH